MVMFLLRASEATRPPELQRQAAGGISAEENFLDTGWLARRTWRCDTMIQRYNDPVPALYRPPCQDGGREVLTT